MGAMLARDGVRSRARGKVPSAPRVACIARSACTSLDQNSNEAESKQWIVVSGTNTMGHGLHVADRVQGLTGTLLHDVIWWVNSWISVELVLFIVLLMDDVASFIKNTKKS